MLAPRLKSERNTARWHHNSQTAIPGSRNGKLGVADKMSKRANWIMELADLLACEPELPIPGFPNFDEYVEVMGDGWGPGGRCEMCGAQAEKVTNKVGYCFPCMKMEWGADWGAYFAVVKLGRHLHEGLYIPVLRWLGDDVASEKCEPSA